MNAVVQTQAPQRVSLIHKMAAKYSVDADKMLVTLKATAFRNEKVEVSNEQMMALLVVADQYDLNPWTKEIYAFPDKKNGIVPVVGVDGWSRIINSSPQFDGMEFNESEQLIESTEHQPCPAWIECVIYRKDRSHAIKVRERFSECYRPPFKGKGDRGEYTVNGPWQSHTSRMLRHKAMIQGARTAFGFVGIYDPDEAERIAEAIDVTPAPKSGNAAAKQLLGVKAKEKAPAENATEIETLRACKDLDTLKAAWKTICADYQAAEREMPVEVEATYNERTEGLMP